jgi:DNA-binding CsgD family transcriptional regulator
MFLVACSLSWLTTPEGLLRECLRLGADVAGCAPSETRACIASVLSRARDAAAGTPRRYRYANRTIITNLRISEEEMRRLGLRCLVTEDIARELDAERKRQARRDAGMVTREEYLVERHDRRQLAVDLSARGLTSRQVGQQMALSPAGVRKLLERARAEGVMPSPILRPILLNSPRTPGYLPCDTSVRVYDGEPQPLVQTGSADRREETPLPARLVMPFRTEQQRPSTADGIRSSVRWVQLDLFERLEPIEPWAGGTAPDAVRTNLRSLIRATGMTQGEIAEKVGLSRSQFGNVVAGRFGTRPDVAARLAALVSAVVARAA